MKETDKAYEILVNEHKPMLMTYIRSWVPDAAHVEDLVQESFLAAYESLETFRQDASFGAWLRGIARNRIRQSQRTQARRGLIVDSRIVEGMEDVYAMFDTPNSLGSEWEDRVAVLRHCVNRLASRLKEAVHLFYIEGLSLREISEHVHASADAVGQRLSRARVEIRKCVTLRLTAGNR